MPRARRPGPATLATIGVLLVALGFLTMLSIGIFLLPLGLAILLGAAVHDRPWIVVGLVAGALALSVGYAATAPWSCTGGSFGTSCSRLALPDLAEVPGPGDYWLALGVALATAVLAGTGVALLARRMRRRTRAA